METVNRQIEKSRESFALALIDSIEKMAQAKATTDKFTGNEMELSVTFAVRFEDGGKPVGNQRLPACCVCFYGGNGVIICHGPCCDWP